MMRIYRETTEMRWNKLKQFKLNFFWVAIQNQQNNWNNKNWMGTVDEIARWKDPMEVHN